jgi:hypothetical protein
MVWRPICGRITLVHVELRIHGVSGTPADSMLGGPTEADERFGSEPSTVLRPVDGDSRLLTYRWASQTSGSASSAMWLLLLPYMFVNLAGWALPPASDRRHRLAVAAVRIAGLLLTLVFALVTANGVIGVGAYQVVRPLATWDLALTLGVAVSATVIAALWFATTRADRARNDRPYLRDPHIAVALWGIWATAVTAASEAGGGANPIGTMWLLPAALAVLVAAASLWRGLEEVTRVFGRVAIASSLALLASVVTRPLGSAETFPATLQTVGGPLRGAILAYGIAAVVVTALAWSSSHRDAGPAVGALMALAGSTGAAVGAGAVVVSGAVFGVSPSEATGALAEAFFVGTVCVVLMVLIHGWTHLEPADQARRRIYLTLVSVRDDVRPILLAIPLITLVLGVLAIGGFEEILPWLGAMAGAGAIFTAIAITWRLGYRGVSMGLLVLGLGIGATAVTGVLPFRVIAVAFTLVLPFLAVLVRIVGAIRDADRRRMLAIPWDVGSFFSRRFHPFAPPTYRDVVERDLKMVVSQLRGSGDQVVVSAHSQGSIVAVSALGSMPGDDTALLTHGSPLASLYMRFFPVSFPPEAISAVAVRPWINLWRPTDPIGGAVPAADDRRIEDPNLRVHGGYWFSDEPAYSNALSDLSAESPR